MPSVSISQAKVRPSSADILKFGGVADIHDFTEEAEGDVLSVMWPSDELRDTNTSQGDPSILPTLHE